MEELIGILIVFILFALMVVSLFLNTNTMIIVAVIGFAIIIGLFVLMIKLDKKRRAENNSKKKIDYDDFEEDDEKPKKSLLQTIEEESKKSKSEYSDKELDEYGLEDWQKDLVKKGDFNPWNFEEENLEEDDYYYDDDDK